MCLTSPPYYGLRDYQVDGQIGLEDTPESYVERLVEVFREVRRVLRNDGTLWLNLASSYAGNRSYQVSQSKHQAHDYGASNAQKVPPGFKAKDLIAIPWMVGLALQRDGWWLRSDTIWHKTNALPSSATDRPTLAHEYVLLLTKSARYFFDATAVREPAKWERWGDQTAPKYEGSDTASGWMKSRSKEDLHDRRERHIRSVWSVPTESFGGQHFAVMAQEIARRCILAGTSEKGCCPECGAPWERETERVDQGWDGSRYGERAVSATGGAISGGTTKSTLGSSSGTRTGQYETLDWRSGCDCSYQDDLVTPHPVPCVALDPFAGSGTTGLVARNHGRHAILIELSPDYCDLAAERLRQLSLMSQ